ncbi:MAG: DUF2202 domain-containing protein [Ignavibacteriales bacterium]|nr:DUF2202 domain-containing protein [Ignavibacteriales bacterium]MBK7981282.1 DUF2202 domain-containing protein [Ignavibacteriota bacterium]
MKSLSQIFAKLILTAFTTIIIITACNSPVESNNVINSGDVSEVLKAMPIEEINSDENEGLVFMREEEKLARDIYLVLYKKWNANVFNNISKSEQKHTDAIKILLDKYQITDPVISDEVGVFSNPDLQALYNTLIEKGNTSLIEALKVGAAIEEIDILDLQKNLEKVDNEDITYVYNNLMRGSRNHLRAFNQNLEAQEVDYKAQYLDQDQFEAIVSTSIEKGSNRGRGRNR